MVGAQVHRGPDDEGTWIDAAAGVALGHNRLRILDLTPAGRQPMSTPDGELTLVFNGEVYNYLELRRELDGYPFRTQTDSEVVLAAYRAWGAACLERFVGMFAFAVWDARRRTLFAARDRFGVKPFHYVHQSDGTLRFASEIKALHAGGVEAAPDEATWATWLSHGLIDHGDATFWRGVRRLAPGHCLEWREGRLRTQRWYDLPARADDEDRRNGLEAAEEMRALLEESVRLRFRSDVPVGVNLSGGLDSSLLLGLVHAVQGESADDVSAFTFVTGDKRYDELPWVERMLERTKHPLVVCRLDHDEVPGLARSVADHQDEPYGGLPTLAYARLFECARERGVTVLLDGQGVDESWAGYDYYRTGSGRALVQGTRESPVRPDCLVPAFRERARPFTPPRPFDDRLRNLQWRDVGFTKLPRALRFNDRVSMRSTTELREPFLDHRLVELGLRQPARRKVGGGEGKILLRRLACELAPQQVAEAPKRPLQTPQREWLRGPLRGWVEDLLDAAFHGPCGPWLHRKKTRSTWGAYLGGRSDNSFYVWQWISLGLLSERATVSTHE